MQRSTAPAERGADRRSRRGGAHDTEARAFRGKIFLFLLLLLAVHGAVNYWWLRADDHIVRFPERALLETARSHYAILMLPDGAPAEKAAAMAELAREDPSPSLLAPLAGSFSAWALGYSLNHMFLANTGFFLLLLFASYFLARCHLPPWAAFYVTAIVSLTPGLYTLSRYFTPDIAAAAFLILCAHALVRSGGFQRPLWSLLAGLWAGLALLSMGSIAYFLAPLALLSAVRGFLSLFGPEAEPAFEWDRLARIVMQAAAAALIAGGLMYPWLKAHPEAMALAEAAPVEQRPPLAALPPPPDEPSPDEAAGDEEAAPDLRDLLAPLDPLDAAPASPNRAPEPPRNALGLGLNGIGSEEPTHPWIVALEASPWTWRLLDINNNAAFPAHLLLAILGLLAALFHPMFRNFGALVHLGIIAGALLCLALDGAPARSVLPALPALASLAAYAAMLPPSQGGRLVTMGGLAAWLVFAYGNLTFAAYGPIARAEAALPIAREGAPATLAVYQDRLEFAGLATRPGAPVRNNPHHRLFSLMRAAEHKHQTADRYANYVQFGTSGMAFLQQHYWPPPNAFLRRDVNPDEAPRRSFYSLAAKDRFDQLLPFLPEADYVVYAAAAGAPAEERSIQEAFEAYGFVLFDRFDMTTREDGVQRAYGLLARDATTQRRLAVRSMAEMDGLSLFELNDLKNSPMFGQLTPDLRQYAGVRIGQLIDALPAPQSLTPEVEFLAIEVARTGLRSYRFRFLFRVLEAPPENWEFSFRGRVADADLHHLPEDRRMLGYMEWRFTPTPPSRAWSPGELRVISTVVTAEPIAYRFQLGVFTPEAGFQGANVEAGALDLAGIP